MKNKYYRLGWVALLAMLAGFASATTRWTGGAGTTDWTNDANWDGGMPDGTENVYVSANGVNGTAVLSTSDSGGTFGVGWYANGTSTLTIASGGSFSNTGTSTLGRYANAQGTINVDAGQFTSGDATSDDLIVGYEGIGVLNVLNGGTVASGDFYLGYDVGGAGTLTVDGSGSALTSSGNTFVLGRSSSSGTLRISHGGVVNTSGTVYMGNVSSATAIAVVEGSGSAWKNTGTLLVGEDGNGTLYITNSGLVSAGSLTIDQDLDGDGVVLMDSGGMLGVADGGTAATTLTEFLALVGGTDNIDYWDGSAWTDITGGTQGTDYTLDQYSENSVSYSRLTVIPEPATIGLVCMVALGLFSARRMML